MYRTGDPRFRRRLNEIGHTLESANESAQSNLYIFGQTYVKPCFESVTGCFTTCLSASCPILNITTSQRDRIRRQRGRSRTGRAELNFDFYDDWDEDENDALMGWGGNDEFDRLLAGSAGYGTLQQQEPARQRGMSYLKARRKSTLQAEADDPTIIPGSSNFFGRLFGGKAKNLRYQPSAADLQDHPGHARRRRDLTEGEALLQGSEEGRGKKHRRIRSDTVTSGHTTDSLSSRGDIFPSDEELDDAIPLDDEFAMVLERRTTQASGGETETSSGRTRRSGKRPSAGSMRSRKSRSRTNSSAAQTPVEEVPPEATLTELKQEETRIEREEEEEVERKRQEAQRLAAERGLAAGEEDYSSKEATPKQMPSPVLEPVQRTDEPSQLPTPLATDDEEEGSVLGTSQEQDSGFPGI
ncbi:hypothetical protein LTR37_014950 [Vermiconidia calcicola]|uniref:Uncharacterized protein n=1 Tax=Vermiconidia calcicola TaxID=1690605 RepID=A0ACC3MTA5_9PEZI|nr:hypothetical protein LTR37_014950 [Vermiconidia calcicola]